MAKGKGGFIGQDGLNAPDSPTGVSASAGNAQADVSFTAPSDVGGSAITGYRAQSNDGIGASGSSSPITVTGLTNGTSYTFSVWAINAFGYSAPSDVSGSVSPTAPPRGIFVGGLHLSPTTVLNELQYVTITTTGNTQDFGDLTESAYSLAGLSSSTRGVRAGGNDGVTGNLNTMDYVSINSTGNATDFGDLSTVSIRNAGASNETRGLFALGYTGSYVNTTEYITIASTGNSTDFGDRTTTTAYSEGAVASTTRAVFGPGYNGSYQNVIDYFTIASTGNATDFGDATVARYGVSAGNSSTRGLFVGGYGSGGVTNIADYITIASAGNATDFGDLSTARYIGAGCSSTIRMLIGGGNNYVTGNNYVNEISYFTIASTGNDTDFGDLSNAISHNTGFSNSHGGLS